MAAFDNVVAHKIASIPLTANPWAPIELSKRCELQTIAQWLITGLGLVVQSHYPPEVECRH
jgi:hypothetical protein